MPANAAAVPGPYVVLPPVPNVASILPSAAKRAMSAWGPTEPATTARPFPSSTRLVASLAMPLVTTTVRVPQVAHEPSGSPGHADAGPAWRPIAAIVPAIRTPARADRAIRVRPACDRSNVGAAPRGLVRLLPRAR